MIQGRIYFIFSTGILFAGCKPPAPAPPAQVQEVNPLAGLSESHIKGNNPVSSNFDVFLKRDLTAYFTKMKGQPIVVDYEYLRVGPTQSGVSYPKYYLWVKMQDGANVTEEGAARVAAIEEQKLDVTHYLPAAYMKEKPETIAEVFPLEVGEKIKARLK